MAKQKQTSESLASEPVLIAGKLFGLTKDPVKKFDFQMYFLIEASVSAEGEILSVKKSSQSWMLWEARHKLERAVEDSLVQIQKGQ
jgi:hypothetical protein